MYEKYVIEDKQAYPNGKCHDYMEKHALMAHVI